MGMWFNVTRTDGDVSGPGEFAVEDCEGVEWQCRIVPGKYNPLVGQRPVVCMNRQYECGIEMEGDIFAAVLTHIQSESEKPQQLAESMVNALPANQQNLLMQNTRSTHSGETEPEREVERHTVKCGGHREWTVDMHADGTCEIRDEKGHIAHKSDSHKSTAIHFAMALDDLRQTKEGFTRLYEAKGNGSSE